MSKSEQIRRLYATGLSPQAIAARVGCLDSYVRVVARQRTAASGMSKHDWQYVASLPPTSAVPDKIAAHARSSGRQAYERVRREGGSVQEAEKAYARAYVPKINKARRAVRCAEKGA